VKAAASPGETSALPSASAVAITANGARAMKSRGQLDPRHTFTRAMGLTWPYVAQGLDAVDSMRVRHASATTAAPRNSVNGRNPVLAQSASLVGLAP
jgi:hypothetical protein